MLPTGKNASPLSNYMLKVKHYQTCWILLNLTMEAYRLLISKIDRLFIICCLCKIDKTFYYMLLISNIDRVLYLLFWNLIPLPIFPFISLGIKTMPIKFHYRVFAEESHLYSCHK